MLLGDSITYDQPTNIIFDQPGATMPAIINSNTMVGGVYITSQFGIFPVILNFEFYKNGLPTGFSTGPINSSGYAQFLPTYAAITLAPGDTLTVGFSGELLTNTIVNVGNVSVMLQAN
jgi:hypothetical protein